MLPSNQILGAWIRTALNLDLSSLAMDCVFLVMMAHDSQVASNSMTERVTIAIARLHCHDSYLATTAELCTVHC